ncbi:MAG TPA: OmpA family protein [Flavobacteriales bacterium]|jgi:outer membrane protein OmpA-like peptidoglycan-associated protein|nr:OmpA family protein [Flavobacteriales bacterium]MBK8706895.1 OmpA family protein [Flavobacteriales bacterium]MBP9178575.1 OmpA family protein [Flavobacteriales bacterium]HQW99616.1 OmpA family protein [Flavobacteriales bacterium]
MRRVLPFAILGVLTMSTTQAQEPNLVNNGGFETRSPEVKTWDELSRASGWSNANGGSADVFSSLGKATTVGIPDNELGTSNAFEGESYAGFVAWKDDQRPNWKRMFNGRDEQPTRDAWNQYSEYMEMALTSPLIKDQKYDISFMVKLASNSDRAISGIGAHCSSTELKYAHRHFLSESADVSSTTILDNKKDWVEVKGMFMADGDEKFIVIGAFGAKEKKDVIEGADNQRAYYYIDGIALRLHPEDDRDKDGVPDKEDSCPDEAGLATLGGCPDGDGDGVADKMDACPTLAGPVTQQGCPDSDGDGIADNVDKCPKVAGVKEMKGCPAIKEETKKLFEKALTGIQFETGSAVIKKSSYGILDQVVSVMNENPEYNLEVHGHTDSQGDDAKNLTLSEKRAASVRDYLTEKGVNGDRLRSSGHGETAPVADNGTSAGRAKNRRVEFKVMFWE